MDGEDAAGCAVLDESDEAEAFGVCREREFECLVELVGDFADRCQAADNRGVAQKRARVFASSDLGLGL